MAYNVGPAPESRDAYQRRRYAQVQQFEEAIRALADEHGFWVKRTIMDDDQEDATFNITIDFLMVKRLKATTGETIRLEEGRR